MILPSFFSSFFVQRWTVQIHTCTWLIWFNSIGQMNLWSWNILLNSDGSDSTCVLCPLQWEGCYEWNHTHISNFYASCTLKASSYITQMWKQSELLWYWQWNSNLLPLLITWNSCSYEPAFIWFPMPAFIILIHTPLVKPFESKFLNIFLWDKSKPNKQGTQLVLAISSKQTVSRNTITPLEPMNPLKINISWVLCVVEHNFCGKLPA